MLRQSGHEYYVMMRPDQNEMPLPAPTFRWRRPDGHEILTSRIGAGYLTKGDASDMERKIERLLQTRQDGLDHIMILYGVGDHGGGPTRAELDWIIAHRDFKPGVRLELSTVSSFFAAVEPCRESLPVVTGELSAHARGRGLA